MTRAICRGTVKQVRGDVLADFTRALSARYGESIAHEAISAAGLSPDRCLRRLGLPSATVRQVKSRVSRMIVAYEKAIS